MKIKHQKLKSAGAFLTILLLLPYVVTVFVNGIDVLGMSQEPCVQAETEDQDGEKTVRTVPWTEYMMGILGKTMPASYEKEALKAQAVVLRTMLYQQAAQDVVFKEAYLTPEEFPQVNRLLHSLENLSDLPIGNSDYVCVMTRGHANDIQVLKGILPKDPYYVGIVGNKMKAEKYPQHFQGTPLYEVYRKKVHLPVGLPIRALTPEEIAVSIAGEIILSYRSNC